MNDWLLHDASMPAAHVSEDLPFEENRLFFGTVARELTHAVWDIALDQHLRRNGFSTAIRANVRRRAGELTTYHAPSSYVVPAWQELRQGVEYVRLARVAAGLPVREAQRLIGTARRVNRETAEKGEWSLVALRSVRWGSADSFATRWFVYTMPPDTTCSHRCWSSTHVCVDSSGLTCPKLPDVSRADPSHRMTVPAEASNAQLQSRARPTRRIRSAAQALGLLVTRCTALNARLAAV
jgi:hypothetical protein